MNDFPGLDAPGAIEAFDHPEHMVPAVVLTDGFLRRLDQAAFLMIPRW